MVEGIAADMAVAVALAVVEPFVAAFEVVVAADTLAPDKLVFGLLKDLCYPYINPSGGYSPSPGVPQGNCSPVAES